MKSYILILLLILALVPVFGEPLHSPAWGFRIDLPEGYEFTEGNSKDRFSFEGPGGGKFDIAVYNGTFKTLKNLVDDTTRRLQNKGDVSFFEYNDKLAALMELHFSGNDGWGLCVELTNGEQNPNTPMFLALAYGPAGKKELELLHMSALDSIVPSEAERRYPGPIIEFGFPRGEAKRTKLAGSGLEAWIHENDAEAAQALIDREFNILNRYQFLENWQEAWIRFYRAIYRDSWDRLSDAVFQLERNWNVPTPETNENRSLAEKALAWVQGFKYERDLMGSDFVNLVSAVTQGRGDCDSRAMLWAIILAQADIPAAMMVSREYSHAMGLADLPGTGAHFEAGSKKWLVAETTAAVDIGLIGQDVSNIESWLGIIFE
jgi:hypothetical protein